MRRGIYSILGGAAIIGLLQCANYAVAGQFGFFHDGRGGTHLRDALVVFAAFCSIVWGIVAIVSPQVHTKVVRSIRDERSVPRRRLPQPPPIVVGSPNPGDAIDYDERVVGSLKPASVLLELASFLNRFPDHTRLDSWIYFDRTDGNPAAEELAELDRKKQATREKYSKNSDFRRAAERLRHTGVECEFGGQGDYCGEFSVLRISGSPASLPLLEAMAADDCGMTSANERANAADRFRIFMLRNYHPGSQSNREIFPDVGPSPYHPLGGWSST